MASKYFVLVADERWMKGKTALNATFAAEAEQFAEDTIDAELDEWKREAWGQPNTPREVARIAEMLASGRYKQLDSSAVTQTRNPDDVGTVLISEAMEAIEKIIGRGFVLSLTGGHDKRADASPSNSAMFMGILR